MKIVFVYLILFPQSQAESAELEADWKDSWVETKW